VVSSKEFRHWLAMYLFEVSGEAPTAADLKRRIELLQAKAAQQETPVREVYVRVAHVSERIYIDLADKNWGAIEVDSDGWRVVGSSPVRFIRTPGMLPLPVPQSGGSIETLQNLFNVHDEEDVVLVIAWLLDALGNDRQHMVLVLTGGEGTAKSMLVAILRALIDPNCMPLGGLPRTPRELTAQPTQVYLQAFDNVSSLSIPMSDALCPQRDKTGTTIMTVDDDTDRIVRLAKE
jgi:hypothetical protein